MKKIIATLLFIGFSCISLSQSKISAGIIVGNKTGITIKKNQIKVDLAWNFAKNDYFGANLDYRIKQDILNSDPKIDYYYGVGAFLGTNNELYLGARIPIGVEYKIPKTSLDAFGEIVPEIGIIPGTNFGGGVGLGMRYMF